MHMIMTRMNPDTIPTMVGMLKVRKSRFQAVFMPPLNVKIYLKCIKSTNIFDLMYDTECVVLFLQSNISNVYSNIYVRVVHYVITRILQIKLFSNNNVNAYT